MRGTNRGVAPPLSHAAVPACPLGGLCIRETRHWEVPLALLCPMAWHRGWPHRSAISGSPTPCPPWDIPACPWGHRHKPRFEHVHVQLQVACILALLTKSRNRAAMSVCNGPGDAEQDYKRSKIWPSRGIYRDFCPASRCRRRG